MISRSIIEFRRERIGGSDIAAIKGVSPFAGPATVLARILGQPAKDARFKAALDAGNRNEHEVARIFAANHPGYMVVSARDAVAQGLIENLPGFKARVVELQDRSITFCHPDADFLLYNVDYFVLSRNSQHWGVLEIKTSSEFAASDWSASGIQDGCPAYYLDQPRYYNAGLGGHFSYVACRLGNSIYREYPITPLTPEKGDELMGMLIGWYERHVLWGELLLPTLYDKGNIVPPVETVTADSILEAKIQRHVELNLKIKALKAEYEPIDQELKSIAGLGSLVDRHGEVLFSTTSSDQYTFDVDRFEREHPELFAQYLTTTHKTRTTRGSAYDARAREQEQREQHSDQTVRRYAHV